MKNPVLFALALATLPLTCRAGEPVALFDGKSLAGWTSMDGGPPSKGWVVEDGVLFRKDGGGDIYTAEEYGDFELSFEWKLAPKANSGVKYRMHRYGNGSVLGLEYQMIDDSELGNTKSSTGSAYDLLAPSEDKKLNPGGEWNTTKIVARGSKIEHWLNGKLILTFDTASPEFAAAVAKSKFKELDNFARNPKGRIMLQDHGDQAWFRNITLKTPD